MQRIERYGVIALVFLLVTILAVSIWGEGQAQDVLTSVKEKAAGALGGITAADTDAATELVPGGRRATQRGLPLASGELQKPRKRGARKGGLRREESLEDAFVTLESRRGSAALPTPTSRIVVPARQASAAERPPAQPAVARASEAQRPAARPRAATHSGPRTYKIRAGDTMGEIAQRELGTFKRWGEIQSLNGGLDPAKLRVGMTIKLPAGSGRGETAGQAAPRKAAPKKVAAARPRSADGSYSVRKGDSLSAIAQRELGQASRWKEIAALNPGIDPQRLAVGTELVLPGGRPAIPARTQQVASLSPSERSAGRGRVR